MIRRVLLTGASGFVGSHVLEALLRRADSDVVVLASFTQNGTMDRILDVTERYGRDSLTVIAHDLRAPLSSRQRAQVGAVDAVVDVASLSSVDESLGDPECFVRNNVEVTLTTLELARTLRVERYLHLSTDEVYGSDRPSCRTDHRPSSPYAASKAAQEDLCYAWARSFGVPLTIITSANMFGPRQSTLAFVPRVVRAALRNEPVRVHVHAGQPGSRRYNYVGDVGAAIVDELHNAPAADRIALPGRYHVDNRTLANDVWYLTCELANLPAHRVPRLVDVEASEVRPGYDPTYSRLDADDDSVWLSPSLVDESPYLAVLSDTVDWFVGHRDWFT